MEVKIFTSSLMRESFQENELSLLVKQFKEYKSTGVLPSIFGRDVTYDRPDSAKKADLSHIHISERNGWEVKVIQFRRTSDIHLIYCRGFKDINAYLLIAVIENAHEKARNINFMINLSEIAERFRKDF